MLTNRHLLQAFEAAGAAAGTIYLSVPITSGRREIAILQELGIGSREFRSKYPDRWRDEVIRPNEGEALMFADKVRADAAGLLVVDPSRMTVTGWDQDDYNGFWVRLLERYAVQVAAAPGWEFSKGARGEVGAAVALGLPVVDIDGRTLARADLEAADRRARTALIQDGWAEKEVDAYLTAMNYVDPPRLQVSPASRVFEWLVEERAYQVHKFGTALDDEHTRNGLGDEGWWWRQLMNYYHRAGVLGCDAPVGRQALAKFVATACGLLESVVRVYGPLPPAGVPSGETGGHARPTS